MSIKTFNIPRFEKTILTQRALPFAWGLVNADLYWLNPNMAIHPERRPRRVYAQNRLCHFSVVRGQLRVRPTDIFYAANEFSMMEEYTCPRYPSLDISGVGSATETSAYYYALAMDQPVGD